jgi:hypothetical protein
LLVLLLQVLITVVSVAAAVGAVAYLLDKRVSSHERGGGS